MANIIMVPPTLGDGATIESSSGSAGASLGPENLQSVDPTEKWVSPAGTAHYVVLDLGASASYDTISLLHTNASAAGWEVRVRTDPVLANLTTTPDYDSGAGNRLWAGTATDLDEFGFPGYHSLLKLGSTRTDRYMRIDVTAPSSQEFSAGRLVVGKAFSPRYNILYGSGLPTPIEFPVIVTTEGVSGVVRERPRKLEVDFILQHESEQEYNQGILRLQWLRGSSGDLLYVFDHEAEYAMTGMILGRMTYAPNRMPEYETYESNITVRES